MRRDAWTKRAKAQPASGDIWRRLERAFEAGTLREGAVLTYTQMMEVAETTAKINPDHISLCLAEHRSPLRLTRLGVEGYRVSRRGATADAR
jgi:hypothetical protein